MHLVRLNYVGSRHEECLAPFLRVQRVSSVVTVNDKGVWSGS